MSETTERKLKKTTVKRAREFEVVESDRIELVEAANDFVRHMVDKQVLPIMMNGQIGVDVQLSDQETKTLDAALRFLERQFETGPMPSEPFDKSVETEISDEYEGGTDGS